MSTIFVTGATGVIGRATIPRLRAAGYTVRALSRTTANDEAIRALGAEPVRGDLFDVESLKRAMSGADVVMHLATKIPPSSAVRKREAWVENDWIRAVGTRRLVDAALATGARVFVYPSFAFVYPDSGDAWIDAASTPVKPVATVQSTLEAERQVARFASSANGERRGVSLRFGGLYGENVPSIQEQLELARRGIASFGGAPNAFVPMLWIEDAATALIAAAERAPSGVYDVVDDDPPRQKELKSLLASVVGKRWLFAPPPWLTRVMAGPSGEAFMRSMRISNRRFKEATGWRPSATNAAQGMALLATAGKAAERPRVPGVVRAGLWAMALFALIGGLQQQFVPRWFYENFPGFGMTWVSVDGPYNEHFLRDLGGANLALAVVTFFALARPSVGLVRAVAAGMLVAQVPHFTYHATHLGLLATPLDRVLQTIVLALVVLVPILVLLRASDIETRERDIGTTAAGTAQPAGGSGRLIAAAR